MILSLGHSSYQFAGYVGFAFDIISMWWLWVLFSLYSLFILAFVIYSGLNYHRLQGKRSLHPQVITYMIPFIVNFFTAKYLFGPIHPFFTTLLPCLVIYFMGNKLKSVRIFGLTGGIAAGKSTLVSSMISHLQEELLLIDCDQINRDLSYKGQPGYNLILSMLKDKKDEFLNPVNKQIQREKFSNFVFENPYFRKELTRRMGMKIMWQIVKKVVGALFGKKKLVLIDAPILFETKVLQHICYPIIVVGCERQTQIKRLIETRRMSEEEAISRIDSQMPLELKKKKADIYVNNSGTVEQMFTECLRKLNLILRSDKKRQ